jgi:hypothetical protein
MIADHSLKKLLEQHHYHVTTFGWAVQGVFPNENTPEGARKWFAYTIGLLARFHHPELLVAGLPLDTAMHVLNCAGELVRKGTVFESGSDFNGVLKDLPVRAVQITDRYMGIGHRYYQQYPMTDKLQVVTRHVVGTLPVLQLLWPDKDGNFPGEPDVDAATAKDQTLEL